MENSFFLTCAKQRNSALKHWRVRPVAVVKCVHDDAAWQGWQMRTVSRPAEFLKRPFRNGERFILDFGEEFVGRLSLRLRSSENFNDSPVRLKLIFAESPVEIGERNRRYQGSLSRAWIQEEIVTLDDMPQLYKLPRVYAMRYLYFEVIATPGKLCVEEIYFTAQSAVRDLLPPQEQFDADEIQLDRAAQRTLRNCMQEVVLDGPKRDRRLWLGDLRLEAQVNAVTFRNFDLFERCIYLLAAFPHANGQIPACIFDKPHPYGCRCVLSDYSFLFSDLLLLHYQETGNRKLLEEMYPLAKKQFDLFRADCRNTFSGGGIPKTFIDWCNFDRTVAGAGTYLFSLRKLAAIAAILGQHSDRKAFEREVAELVSALRAHTFDPGKKLFVSGPKREISWASQIWMVLAETVTGDEAKELLARLEETPEAISPVTPYLHHHLLAAYDLAGEPEKLRRHLRNYWGKMIQAGMNVFPEVFVPDNPRLTPYGNDPRINSACHAWSCAPAYFLRKKQSGQ